MRLKKRLDTKFPQYYNSNILKVKEVFKWNKKEF